MMFTLYPSVLKTETCFLKAHIFGTDIFCSVFPIQKMNVKKPFSSVLPIQKIKGRKEGVFSIHFNKFIAIIQ